MKHNATHNATHKAHLQARLAIERGLETPVFTVQARALLASIHDEIAPQLQAMRAADECLNRQTKGRPTGTVKCCGMEPGAWVKCNHEFVLAPGAAIPGNLARENSEFAALYAARMNEAGENTRSCAGGAHAQD